MYNNGKTIIKQEVIKDMTPELMGTMLYTYYLDGSVLAKSLFNKKEEYTTNWRK